MIGAPHLRTAAPDADGKAPIPLQGDGGDFDAALDAAVRGDPKQAPKAAVNATAEGEQTASKTADGTARDATGEASARAATPSVKGENGGQHGPNSHPAIAVKTAADPSVRPTSPEALNSPVAASTKALSNTENDRPVQTSSGDAIGSPRPAYAPNAITADALAAKHSKSGPATLAANTIAADAPVQPASRDRNASSISSTGSAVEPTPADLAGSTKAVPVRHALSWASAGAAQPAEARVASPTSGSTAAGETPAPNKTTPGGARPLNTASIDPSALATERGNEKPALSAGSTPELPARTTPSAPSTHATSGSADIMPATAADPSAHARKPASDIGSNTETLLRDSIADSTTLPHEAKPVRPALLQTPSAVQPEPVTAQPSQSEATDLQRSQERGEGRSLADHTLPSAIATPASLAPTSTQPAAQPQPELMQRAVPQHQAQPLASDPKPQVRQVAHVVRQETHFAPVLPTTSTNAAIQAVPANVGIAAAAAAIADSDSSTTSGRQVLERGRPTTPVHMTTLSASAAPDALGSLEQAAAVVSQVRSAVIANLAALPLSADLVRSEAAERQRTADAMQAGQNTNPRSAGPVRVLELSLQPASLGSVTVRLRLSSDGLSVDISASDPTALEALEGGEDALRAALSGAGYATSALTVSRATPDKTFFAPLSESSHSDRQLDPSGFMRF